MTGGLNRRRAGGRTAPVPLEQVVAKIRATHALSEAFSAFGRGLPVSRESFVAACRSTASRLDHTLSREVRRLPFTWLDNELMCRCMITCDDLEDAIGRAIEFCRATGPHKGGRLALRRGGDAAFFSMDTLLGSRSAAARLIDIFGLIGFQQLFGWLIGEPLRTRMVALSHGDRDAVAPFIGFFNAPVMVSQPGTGIEFDAAQLARPVVRNKAELKVFLKSYPFPMLELDTPAAAIARRVEAQLDAAIHTGDGAPTIDVVARRLALSAATLRRHLRSEGVGFQQLKERCQQRAAHHYLARTDRSIEEIALLLGFSGAVSFRRAFLRWTGTAPTSVRTAPR